MRAKLHQQERGKKAAFLISEASAKCGSPAKLVVQTWLSWFNMHVVYLIEEGVQNPKRLEKRPQSPKGHFIKRKLLVKAVVHMIPWELD